MTWMAAVDSPVAVTTMTGVLATPATGQPVADTVVFFVDDTISIEVQ